MTTSTTEAQSERYIRVSKSPASSQSRQIIGGKRETRTHVTPRNGKFRGKAKENRQDDSPDNADNVTNISEHIGHLEWAIWGKVLLTPPAEEEKKSWDGVGDLGYHDGGADEGVECYYCCVSKPNSPFYFVYAWVKEGSPVVEQTQTIPTSSTAAPSRRMAQTGTPRVGCIEERREEKNRASSRAKDHVSREAV